MPTQPLWNLGPAPVDFYSMLTGIGRNIAHQNESNLDRAEREKERQRLIEQQNGAGDLLAKQAALFGQSSPTASPAGQLLNLSENAPPSAPSSRSMPTFGKIEGAQPSANIRGVIQSAAATQQLSPEYMERMAAIESGYDPNAKNPSGAAGLFQFVPGTWRQYGGGASPFDPSANAMAAAAFTKDNQNALRQQLGRDPTHGELYLAHQQGAGGAAGLLSNPDRPAAEVVGLKAVASNLPRGAGDPRTITASQFASLWTRRFADLDGARQPQAAPAPPRPVVVAENEDEVQRAEAAMMPRQAAPQLPAMAAGRAMTLPGAADVPAPGASPAGFYVPPGAGGGGLAAAAPTAGAPAVAGPPPAAPAPAAVLSSGIRAAANAGMPPQQLALVQAMARNPLLQSYASQIIGKYAAPQKDPYQRFEDKAGNSYAFDPQTGAVAPVAQFAPKPEYEFQKLDDGRVVAIDKRDPTRSITAAEGSAAGGREMSADERKRFGIPEGTGAYIDAKGNPHTLPGTATNSVQISGEKEFEKKEGEAASKRFTDIQTAGNAARATASQIGELGEIFSRVPAQGQAAEWKQALGPYAQAFGIDVKNLSDVQTAEAIIQRIAPQQHIAGTGSQSDLEYKGLVRSLPTLMQDPQTRATTLAFFQSQNDIAIRKAEIVENMRAGDIDRMTAEKQLRALPDPLTRFQEFRRQNQEAFGAGLSNAAKRDKPGNAPAEISPEAARAELARRRALRGQ